MTKYVKDEEFKSRGRIDCVSFREMITSQLIYSRGSSYATLFVLSSSNRGRLLVQEFGHIHACIFDLMKTKQIQERNTRRTKYAQW